MVEKVGIAFKILDEHVETTGGHLSISTMYLAKGLEFRTVAVMACDNEIIPLQERIEAVGDDADSKEVYDTEHHLPLCRMHAGARSFAGHECRARIVVAEALAVVHAELILIHPFREGNGRVARLLALSTRRPPTAER